MWQRMMDLSMVIIFALLQISIQPAEVVSSPPFPVQDSPAESSRVHRVFPRSPQDKDLFQSNLQWTAGIMNPSQVPVDAVPVLDKKSKQTFYVARTEDCTPCFFDSAKKSCWVVVMHPEFSLGHIQKGKISFLVNKDKFEILEWKKSSYGAVPPLAVETCKGYFIARNELGLGYMTDNSLITLGDKKQDTTENEVLTLNHDIKGHRLNIIKYEINKADTSESVTVLKHFTVSNRNCEAAKHQVKLDQGIDKTVTLLKTRTRLTGGSGEISADGTIVVVKAGGKLSVKHERSHLNSETTATANKDLHSVNVEVQVPANKVCSVDIKGTTFTADVPVTAELTRVYNNNEIRRTSIDDVYSHQEVAEIQTLVNPCTPLSDGIKC